MENEDLWYDKSPVIFKVSRLSSESKMKNLQKNNVQLFS